MQSLLRAFSRCLLTALILPLGLLLISYTNASAQRQTRDERDLAVRERQLRSIGKAVRVEPDIAPPRVTLGQVKDDYEGLQLANNNVLNMISMGNAPDYRLIEEAASEIKKRAGRLKSYMLILQMVRENESRRKSLMDIEPAAIKESLMTLDGAIARLVDNPIFKNFNRVTDADGAIKARDELDDIIDLSEGIRRSARRALKLARASK